MGEIHDSAVWHVAISETSRINAVVTVQVLCYTRFAIYVFIFYTIIVIWSNRYKNLERVPSCTFMLLRMTMFVNLQQNICASYNFLNLIL